jgi:hypothetical protein
LQSKNENGIKKMRDKKATENNDVPGDALKMLGDDK